MMVRVSERTFSNVNLGGIAEAMAFVPWGDEGYFLFPPPLLARRGSSAAQNIFLEEKNMKKHNTMKRLLAIAAAAALTLSLCACGPASEPGGPSSSVDGSAEPSQAVYSVAIIKQMDHPSLDEIAQAIEAELAQLAEDNKVTIQYHTTSGQGDQSTLKQLADQAVADKADVIIPIATTAAQIAAASAEDTQTPVVFATVSDPEAAGLTGLPYVTGTSDALNTRFIIDMMLAQDPELKKVGLLYSLSEVNSAKPIAEAIATLESRGIAYVERTANTNDEVITAVSALIAEGVDAIFTPTDNIIATAELAIYEDLIQAGIPHYTGADSFVRNGAFTTCGVNYTDVGRRTAGLAYQVIAQGMDGMEDFYLMDGGIITVNTETAAGLGADYSVFSTMGTVVEVVTTED